MAPIQSLARNTICCGVARKEKGREKKGSKSDLAQRSEITNCGLRHPKETEHGRNKAMIGSFLTLETARTQTLTVSRLFQGQVSTSSMGICREPRNPDNDLGEGGGGAALRGLPPTTQAHGPMGPPGGPIRGYHSRGWQLLLTPLLPTRERSLSSSSQERSWNEASRRCMCCRNSRGCC